MVSEPRGQAAKPKLICDCSLLFPSLLKLVPLLYFDAVAVLRISENGKDEMASFQSNRRQVSSEGSPVSILYVSDRNETTAFHSAQLRDAGYQVYAVLSREEAVTAIERGHADVVVIGHGLSLEDRSEIEAAARRKKPKPRVVLLYENSIVKTEQADAVLNINSEPQHLVQTIRYLLTGAISDRPN